MIGLIKKNALNILVVVGVVLVLFAIVALIPFLAWLNGDMHYQKLDFLYEHNAIPDETHVVYSKMSDTELRVEGMSLRTDLLDAHSRIHKPDAAESLLDFQTWMIRNNRCVPSTGCYDGTNHKILIDSVAEGHFYDPYYRDTIRI